MIERKKINTPETDFQGSNPNVRAEKIGDCEFCGNNPKPATWRVYFPHAEEWALSCDRHKNFAMNSAAIGASKGRAK